MLKKLFPLLFILIYLQPIHSQEKDSLYFCKDYKDGKEVEVAKTFTLPKTGGELTVMVRLEKPIHTDKVDVELYKLTNDGEVFIESKPWDVEKDWDYIYFSYLTFKSEGKFRVAVLRKNGLEVVSGFVKIIFEKE